MIKPLQDKKEQTVADAFNEIFNTKRKPKMLWTDKGSEFYNLNVKDLLNKHKIKLYSIENEEKSSVVELWNKTIKQKIWKMFSMNNNTVYYDKLNKMVGDCNNTRQNDTRRG